MIEFVSLVFRFVHNFHLIQITDTAIWPCKFSMSSTMHTCGEERKEILISASKEQDISNYVQFHRFKLYEQLNEIMWQHTQLSIQNYYIWEQMEMVPWGWPSIINVKYVTTSRLFPHHIYCLRWQDDEMLEYFSSQHTIRQISNIEWKAIPHDNIASIQEC